MIYLDARSLLYELRSIRTALAESTTGFCDPGVDFAHRRIHAVIEEIENATYLQTLSAGSRTEA